MKINLLQLRHTIGTTAPMLFSLIRIAWRRLQKSVLTSSINILGLAIGIGACLLILLYVRDELSYDRYNAGAGRIYRVVKDFVNDDGSRLPDATTPAALAPAIQAAVPEVDHVTRVFPSWGRKILVNLGEKHFLEERIFRVDSSFFEVFTVPFIEGDPASSLRNPQSIILTAAMAKRYFGSQDPLNKVLHTELGDLAVTGVVKDVPENSHFHYDFLVSIRKLGGGNFDLNWDWYNFYTYVKLKPGVTAAGITTKIQTIYHHNKPEGKNIFYIQSLTDIHLRSDLKWEIEPNGNILYIYVFTVIGLFVIAIACVNYINLTTAKSALRAKEIGIRKVSGAFRSSLVGQFLVESIMTVSLAAVTGVALARWILPVMNELMQKDLDLRLFLQPAWILGVLAVVLVIGLVAGIYPAIYLSSFQPVTVLKGLRLPESSVFNLRKILVVFQFTISIGLIAGTVIVVQQIRYIQRAKLGLNKDQVMIITDAGNLSRSESTALGNRMLAINGVSRVATANGVIGGLNWTSSFNLKGSPNSQLVNFINVSYDYLDVLGISLKEGRNFSPAFPADTPSNGSPGSKERMTGSIILNEKAVKDLGIPEPVVGSLLENYRDHDTVYYVKVIGVAKDFHFASFKSAIKPFAFMLNKDWQDNFTIKIGAANMDRTIASVQNEWNRTVPGRPFHYSFLDETFNQLYQADRRFNQVILYLTSLAIFIGCLGLFGLTAFMIERRTKEIGIRKVVGASASSIVMLLSKDFLRLIVVAMVIATPIAWLVMDKWLRNFVYRIQIDWWVFAAAGLMAVLIALATISMQAIRAALANPVQSLRAE